LCPVERQGTQSAAPHTQAHNRKPATGWRGGAETRVSARQCKHPRQRLIPGHGGGLRQRKPWTSLVRSGAAKQRAICTPCSDVGRQGCRWPRARASERRGMRCAHRGPRNAEPGAGAAKRTATAIAGQGSRLGLNPRAWRRAGAACNRGAARRVPHRRRAALLRVPPLRTYVCMPAQAAGGSKPPI
jgi:hypothetical protein